MPQPSDRIMFEIYREADYGRRYRVVYFTELDEHNKEAEISRAVAGEHVFDGFIRDFQAAEAKRVIAELVDRLNHGDSLGATQIEEILAPVTAA